MDTSGIIFLAVSASISFGLGRLVMHLRARKRKALEKQAQQRADHALRNRPAEPESMNKAKRKRQKRRSQLREDIGDRGQ
jgi:hypothetical protein